MSCLQGNYSPVRAGATNGPFPPGPIASADARVLIVSNAPETLNLVDEFGNATSTLYKCEIPLVAGSVRSCRLFLWHVNPLSASVDLQIRLSLSSDTAKATISDYRREVRPNDSTSDLSVPGICLAKVHLYNSWDAPLPKLALVGTSEAPLWNSGSTDQNRLCAAVIEFSVTPSETCSLRVRTIAGGTPIGEGSWASTVCVPNDPNDPLGKHLHIRGWYPRSAIHLPFGQTSLDTNPDSPRSIHCGVCESVAPPELSALGFAWQGASIDPYGTPIGNNGLYGVDATYDFVATNSDPANSHAAFISVICRNNAGWQIGPKFWGAGWVSSPQGSELGIPVIRVILDSNHNPQTWQWVEITPHLGIIVPGNGSIPISVQIAPGGGSPLPVNIVASNIAAQPG